MRIKDLHFYLLIMSQKCYYYTNPQRSRLDGTRTRVGGIEKAMSNLLTTNPIKIIVTPAKLLTTQHQSENHLQFQIVLRSKQRKGTRKS